MTIEQLTKNLLIILHLEMEYDYFGNLKLNRKDSGNEILAAVDKLEEALAQTEQEPVALPDGKRLILVDGTFDDLMYWLDRCERKGHLGRCYDLVEPWVNFDYAPYTPPPEQEPWCMTMNGCKTKCEDCPDTITAIEEALAQPEQKPLNEVCNEFYQALAKGESSKQFTAQNWFQAGFAISEAAHGIGEKK